MKTEVIMYRNIIGLEIRQKHKSGFFNLKDLERVGNKHRIEKGENIKNINDYFKTPSAKEFIKHLEIEYGDVQVGGRGRGNEKWVHPFLFIDIALWYSASFKVKIYEWVYDNLLIFRDNSGNSFKEMTKTILNNYNYEGKACVIIPEIAREIYKIVGVNGENKWEKATAEQLKKRDEIQTAFSALSYSTKNIKEAIQIIYKMYGVKN
jgi:hypothetical protein